MSIHRKQQSLIGAAVTQSFHHGDSSDWVGAAATVLFGDRHALHAEGSAFLPAITREDLLGVTFDHAAVELATGEFDRCLLKLLLLGCQFKIHGMI